MKKFSPRPLCSAFGYLPDSKILQMTYCTVPICIIFLVILAIRDSLNILSDCFFVLIFSNGEGAYSEEVSCRTYSDIPADPPQNATLEPASSTSIIGETEKYIYLPTLLSSVVDPDPYDLGPPGSVIICIKICILPSTTRHRTPP